MSDLLKIARAARGDDWFRERVQAACALADVAYDGERMLYHVAQACVSAITVGDEQTVDTTGVPDEDIVQAVGSYAPQPTTSGEAVA